MILIVWQKGVLIESCEQLGRCGTAGPIMKWGEKTFSSHDVLKADCLRVLPAKCVNAYFTRAQYFSMEHLHSTETDTMWNCFR